MNLQKQDKINLNQFIAKIGVWYNPKSQNYIDKNGAIIKDCTKYLNVAFKNTFKRTPNTSELAYMQDWLYMPFDFENVPYKTYLKQLVEHQKPSEIKNLKDNYNYYLESIQTSGKTKTCIYISGDSGSGKTTYAKILASKYFNEEEIFISSGGSHPFDEYYGEKCIIVDDFRDSVLAYNDLLRLLDNHTSSNVGARYHNKSLARCEMIILTSVKTLLDLYPGINEERYQLYRRVKYFGIQKDTLFYFEYDKKKDFFDLIHEKDIEKELKQYYSKSEAVKIDITDIFLEVDLNELPPRQEKDFEL